MDIFAQALLTERIRVKAIGSRSQPKKLISRGDPVTRSMTSEMTIKIVLFK